MKKTSLFDCFLLLVVFLPLYLAFSGSSYLWDWDETVYGSAAKQMFERGDYVVPIVTWRLDGSPFYGDKPILMYWGMLASFSLFGVGELPARLPSAVFGTLSLLLVYGLTKRMFNRKTGLLAAFGLGTMLLYCIESSAVTPDATLMFWTTAATCFYIIGVFPRKTEDESSGLGSRTDDVCFPQSWKLFVPLYLCLGFAFLDKGPVGVVLPMAVVGMFMLIKRLPPLQAAHFLAKPGVVPALLRLLRPFHPVHFLKTVWAMRPITAILLIAVVAAPWYVLVHGETNGAWTKLFFGVHNFERAAAPMEGHGYPLDFLWYYPFSLLVITFPWSIFAGAAVLDMVRRLRRGTPQADGYLFATCWACVYVAVFSVVETKMPNYIFIASTGAAIIYAAYLDVWSDKRALIAPAWMGAALTVFLVVGLFLGALVLFFVIPTLVPTGRLLLLVPAMILFAAIRLFMVLHGGKRSAFLFGMVAASLAVAFSAFYLGARIVSRQQNYSVMFAEIDKRCLDPVVCSFDQFEPSWVFYGGRPIVRYGAAPEEIEALRHFLAEHPRNGFVITSRDRYERHLQPVFGERLRPILHVPYFLKLEKVPRDEKHPFGLRQRELLVLEPVFLDTSAAERAITDSLGVIERDTSGTIIGVDLAQEHSSATGAVLKMALTIPHLKRLRLSGGSITSESFASIAGQTELEELFLRDASIRDADLTAVVGALPKLKRLTLRRLSGVSDAGIVPLLEHPSLVGLAFIEMGLTAEGLTAIAKSPRLRTLDLRHCSRLQSPDYRPLGEMTRLTDLKIGGFAVDDTVLAAITPLPNLAGLTVDDAFFTPDGFAAFCECFASAGKLETLVLHRNATLMDTSLAPLVKFPRLKRLTVGGMMICGSFLERLAENEAKRPKLERLSLRHSQMTLDGARGLQKYPELRALDLSGIPLTPEIARFLLSLRQLEEINVSDTALDDETLETLRKMTFLKKLKAIVSR